MKRAKAIAGGRREGFRAQARWIGLCPSLERLEGRGIYPVGARLARDEGDALFCEIEVSASRASFAPTGAELCSAYISRATRKPIQSPRLPGTSALRLPERENTGASPQSLPRIRLNSHLPVNQALPSLGAPT